MGQTTISSPPAENRRAARLRKVRPVAFVAQTLGAEPALQTVTANVSRSGMLLVTRRDQFPPAGAGVLLMPFEMSAGAPDASAAIRGRIVYSRFSPRAKLRFAGLKFEQDLSERSAQMLGLDSAPDAVTDAMARLDQLEAMTLRPPQTMNMPPPAMPSREIYIDDESIMEPDAAPAIDRARDGLEAARREFIIATAAHLSAWGEERIRRTLGERHSLARAKGLDGLRAMKADWMSLQASLAELAAAAIPPAGESETNPYYNTRLDQPPAKLMQALRDVAGHVGRVLIQHGFEDAGKDSDFTPIAGMRGRVSFRGAMTISDPMRDSLIHMAQLHDDLQHSARAAAELRDSGMRAEALRLWDLA